MVKKVTLKKCEDIVSEFDSNGTGTMQYDEFLNSCLPASNQNMRDYVLYGKRVPSYYNDGKLPVEVSNIVASIYENEMRLAKRRVELQKTLKNECEFEQHATFNRISRG